MRMLRKFRLGFRNSETNDLAQNEDRQKMRLAFSMQYVMHGPAVISHELVDKLALALES